MLESSESAVDRYGNRIDPSSIIYNHIGDAEFYRLLKAYQEGHYGILTTVQILELKEIIADTESLNHERKGTAQ